jgi:hypothetical protein
MVSGLVRNFFIFDCSCAPEVDAWATKRVTNAESNTSHSLMRI